MPRATRACLACDQRGAPRRPFGPMRPNAHVWRFCRNLWFVIHEKRARKLHKLLCGRVNLRSVLPPRDIFASGIELAFVVPEQVRTSLAGPFVRGVSVTGVWGGRGAAARISRQKKIGCASSVSRWTGLNMKTYRSSAAHAGANGFVLSVGGRRAALMSGSALIALGREQRRRDGRVPVGCQPPAVGLRSQTPRIAKLPLPARSRPQWAAAQKQPETSAQPSVPGRKQPQRGPQRLA